MKFMDSYKRLEKLCGDLLNNDGRVKAYIDEMYNTPGGKYVVAGWEADLRQLKRYKSIRNQIAHDPDCNEQNMCSEKDVQWLDNFYKRIMNQTDPLALYRKAAKRKKQTAPKKEVRSGMSAGGVVFLITAIALLAGVAIWLLCR